MLVILSGGDAASPESKDPYYFRKLPEIQPQLVISFLESHPRMA
jgi:hypothetical protein